jgi:hypothetical protein
LTNGVARSAVSGARYSWSYFKISVPSGKTRLTVVLDGPNCSLSTCNPNLNLYTRRTYKPTGTYYSCAARTADSDETCVNSYPGSGYWYIGVYVYVGSSVPYTIRATDPGHVLLAPSAVTLGPRRPIQRCLPERSVMARNVVFESFEVHEGFGPQDIGPLVFESASRADADTVLEKLWTGGTTAQLFGIRGNGDHDRVLLRVLVGLKAA